MSSKLRSMRREIDRRFEEKRNLIRSRNRQQSNLAQARALQRILDQARPIRDTVNA